MMELSFYLMGFFAFWFCCGCEQVCVCGACNGAGEAACEYDIEFSGSISDVFCPGNCSNLLTTFTVVWDPLLSLACDWWYDASGDSNLCGIAAICLQIEAGKVNVQVNPDHCLSDPFLEVEYEKDYSPSDPDCDTLSGEKAQQQNK